MLCLCHGCYLIKSHSVHHTQCLTSTWLPLCWVPWVLGRADIRLYLSCVCASATRLHYPSTPSYESLVFPVLLSCALVGSWRFETPISQDHPTHVVHPNVCLNTQSVLITHLFVWSNIQCSTVRNGEVSVYLCLCSRVGRDEASFTTDSRYTVGHRHLL